MMLIFLVLAAGALAYSNSFSGVFVFDDRALMDSLLQPHPVRHILSVSIRPLVDISFWMNRQWGGLEPAGYHAVNLAIHLLAALAFFGIVRQTLSSSASRRDAAEIAAACAVLWEVHPLLTHSVTYIAQRSECLMGLFYFLTLYAFIRASRTSWALNWQTASVAAALAGMACKAVMVTVPFAVLLYDRVFIARSFKEAFQKRGKYYLALAATLLLQVFLSLRIPVEKFQNEIGFVKDPSSWLRYALTETSVILHYEKVALIPHPLCFDYAWPLVKSFESALVPSLLIVFQLVAVLVGLRWRPKWAYLGAWFFLTLAPTSSFFPILDAANEYRMYLPLAALVVMFILLIRAVLGHRRALVVFAALAAVSCFFTIQRNEDYQSDVRLWKSVIAAQPQNARGYHNLAGVYLVQKKDAEAEALFQKAVEVDPGYFEAHGNLGLLYIRKGELEKAAEEFKKAVAIRPEKAETRYDLCLAYLQLGTRALNQGRPEPAIGYFEDILALEPRNFDAWNGEGVAWGKLGNYEKARECFLKALVLEPGSAGATANLKHIQELDEVKK